MNRKMNPILTLAAAFALALGAGPVLAQNQSSGGSGMMQGGGMSEGMSGQGMMSGGGMMGGGGMMSGGSGMMSGGSHGDMMSMMKRMHAKMMKGGMMGGGMMGGAFMRSFDTDHNGKVAADELRAGLSEGLSNHDADGDGMLSIDEFEAFHSARIREMMVDRFQMLDADGDGEVTEAEMEAPAARMERMQRMRAERMERMERMREMRDQAGDRAGHHGGSSDSE